MFKINRHLYRPRPFGQNVIVSQIGGKITESADDAIAPTRDITRPRFGIKAATETTIIRRNRFRLIDLFR